MTAHTNPTQVVTSKVPEALADVAFLRISDACAAAGISETQFYAEVKAGRGPKLYRHGARCTRVLMRDVRAWLIERAERAEADRHASAFIVERAKKAAAAAQAARRARAASGDQVTPV